MKNKSFKHLVAIPVTGLICAAFLFGNPVPFPLIPNNGNGQEIIELEGTRQDEEDNTGNGQEISPQNDYDEYLDQTH